MDFTLRDTKRLQHKTAAYTMVRDDIGTVFTNFGASGAVTFTTPKFTEVFDGWTCKVFVAADQTVTVTLGDADTGVTFNDAAADSVAFSTASKKLGSSIELIADVTNSKWYLFGSLWYDGTNQNTATIAT